MRKKFLEKEGRFEISATVEALGEDLLIVLKGGKSHIGAVAIGEPRPSLRDEGKISATGSVYTFLGHKEDVIAKEMAEEVAKGLRKRTVVVAGMHWDEISPEEIEKVIEACHRLTKKIIKEVRAP